MYAEFDAIVFYLVIACCPPMFIFLTFGHKITWKEFDDDFISSGTKREDTISMNMLKALRG